MDRQERQSQQISLVLSSRPTNSVTFFWNDILPNIVWLLPRRASIFVQYFQPSYVSFSSRISNLKYQEYCLKQRRNYGRSARVIFECFTSVQRGNRDTGILLRFMETSYPPLSSRPGCCPLRYKRRVNPRRKLPTNIAELSLRPPNWITDSWRRLDV